MKMAGSTWDRWGLAEGKHHRDRSRDRSRERSSHYCSRQCSAPPRGDGAPACVQQREQSTMCAEQARAQPSSVYWDRYGIARDCQQRMTERGTNLDRDQLRRPEREGDRGRFSFQSSCREHSQISNRYGDGYTGGRCGGSGGRRGATSEGNIQLNKEISGCGSTSRLCGLITKHAGEFNHVNVATAFRKLLLASRSGMPRGVVEDALQALEQRALETMEDFGAREIANTLHSMAKARYRPAYAALLHDLGVQLRAVAGECNPQNLSLIHI